MKKKRKFSIKSKHLIVVMTILCIGLVTLTLSSKFSIDPVRKVAGYIIVPFQNGINEIGNWLSAQESGFQDVKKLAKDNKELKKQVDSLIAQNSQLVQNQETLTRLQELYKVDKEYSEYNKVAAEIISKDPGNWYSTFVINRGSNDGIQVDNNVITGGGLVGIVTEVGSNWATVRSIIDDTSNVSAMVSSTLDNCMVVGDLKLMDEGKLSFIQLLDKEDKVQVGDKIVTSSISNKYLKGILIGYVDSLSYDANKLTKTGYIIPAVDFKHLQEVLVITDLKQQKEASE